MGMAFTEVARCGAQRAAAVADVNRIMGSASQRARAAGTDAIIENARAPHDLVEHEPQTIEKFLRWFERTPEWRPDGNCNNRTELGAFKLDEMIGLGATPTSSLFAAGLHIEQESADDFLATARTPEELAKFRNYIANMPPEYADLSGRFHSTLRVAVKGHAKPLAIDFKAKHPVVHFEDSPLPERTQLLRPFAGTGVWGGASVRNNWADHTYFDGARRYLNDAIGASTMRIDRSEALEQAIQAVHAGFAQPTAPDTRLMSRIVNDEATFA